MSSPSSSLAAPAPAPTAPASAPAPTAPAPTSPSPPSPALNHSHHLSRLSLARHPSPIKDILRHMARPSMLSLAGGLPHPENFPFEGLEVRLGGDGEVRIGKGGGGGAVAGDEGSIDLAVAMQYGACDGLAPLLAFCRTWTHAVLSPAYSNPCYLLNNGNTDGWHKVLQLLCEPGDAIVVEDATYPSSMACWVPMGCVGVPVAGDGMGLRADRLDAVLSAWDEVKRGRRKPRVLYTVPVGQNPTGTTMPLDRKRAVYDVCVKHDVIIVEDDPYYFLQFGGDDTRSPADADADADAAGSDSLEGSTTFSPSSKAYLDNLAPSFLRIDVQGRVIRLESFSKTLAPGNRLGYFICCPLFAERLLRCTEVTTQTPSGWSQAIVHASLNRWGPEGYAAWLKGLAERYRQRRDWMCDAISEEFDLEQDIATGTWIARSSGTQLFSFTKPMAGMFLWLELDLSTHPEWPRMLAEADDPPKPTQAPTAPTLDSAPAVNGRETLAEDAENIDDPSLPPASRLSRLIWLDMLQAGVLLVPGSYYEPWTGGKMSSEEDRKRETKKGREPKGHVRLAFSFNSQKEQTEGIKRMAGAMRRSWRLQQ